MRAAVVAAIGATLAATAARGVAVVSPDAPPSASAPLGLPPFPPGWAGDGERVGLGRRLFFDPILSVDRSIACSSCHDPSHGFADDEAVSTGVGGQETERNAPSLLNRAWGESFLWDGRFDALEDQVLQPIANEREMALPLDDAVERLGDDAEYRVAFERSFGGPPSTERLAAALATFVRTLVLGDSPVDRFRAGRFAALDAEERLGLWFFESRGKCWQCHSGPLFSDESFHNTGVAFDRTAADEGRFRVTGDDADRGRFKTPSLRGVARTAPYMHDGSLRTLEEVVEFYRRGGNANPRLDARMAPIDMSDRDARNLVRFLEALSR